MTKKDFAKRAGISQTMWCQVLKGDRNLGDGNARRVAKLIGSGYQVWCDGGSQEARKKARLEKWEKMAGRKTK